MKRKTSFLLLILLFVVGRSYGQMKHADNYLAYYQNSDTAKIFSFADDNGGYLDFFLNGTVEYDGRMYRRSVRIYSWGEKDTTNIRQDSTGYYHYDPKINKESLILPKLLKVGQLWYEADSSWSYEVVEVNKKLKTPKEKYKGLIVIECLQQTGRDKSKNESYHIYYAEGLGMVAAYSNGKLGSYLFRVKISD